jgi:anti-sigma-K factor RskA
MNTTTNGASERDEIELLLPWYAAGTLSRRDTARVEDALARDAELARRFDMVREELGETIRVNESLGAPSARAMKQLFEKIDAEAPVQRKAVSVSFATRVSEFIASFSPRTLAYAGAVAALAIVLQAGVIGTLIGERAATGPGLASADRTAISVTGSGVEALVRFSPQASAADIQALLEANNAIIVGGPAAGNFRVRIAAAKPDQAAEIVKKLQDGKVITFAAPAQ